MDKQTLIIQKLLKLADKQQKILERLAQAQDTNVDYLRRAVQTAGVNLSQPLSLTAFVAPKDGGYTVTIDGFPPVNEGDPKDVQRDNAVKVAFKKNFDNQLQAQQKGELLNSLALVYKNKAAGVA